MYKVVLNNTQGEKNPSNCVIVYVHVSIPHNLIALHSSHLKKKKRYWAWKGMEKDDHPSWRRDLMEQDSIQKRIYPPIRIETYEIWKM